jgi:hypothetical protein
MKNAVAIYNSNYLVGNVSCLILSVLVICTVWVFLINDASVFGLKIVQSQMTQDQNKFHHIIGIAQNDLNTTLDNIFVQAMISGENNTILGNYSNQVAVHPLYPSEETPFDVIIYEKNHNNLIKNYTIDFTYEETNKTNERDLEIHSTSSRLDATGFYYISGRITNNMNTIANSTTIIAALIDRNNDLIGIWKAQSEPYDIPPLSTASFTVPVTDRSQGSNIYNYTLYSNNS